MVNELTRRSELHQILLDVLGSDQVFFNPPEGYKLTYPAIIYDLASIEPVYANDKHYIRNYKWTITLIDYDSDSEIRERLMDLPYCRPDRMFRSDGLFHYTFNIVY